MRCDAMHAAAAGSQPQEVADVRRPDKGIRQVAFARLDMLMITIRARNKVRKGDGEPWAEPRASL